MIWRVYHEQRGAHVHCRVFVGKHEGALGLAGKLTLRSEEFVELRAILGAWRQADFREEHVPLEVRVTTALQRDLTDLFAGLRVAGRDYGTRKPVRVSFHAEGDYVWLLPDRRLEFAVPKRAEGVAEIVFFDGSGAEIFRQECGTARPGDTVSLAP